MTALPELLRSVPEVQLLPNADGTGAGAVRLTGVTHDSGAVRAGDLFAAVPGSRVHGARYVGGAVAAGAAAVLTDPAGAVLAGGGGVPVLVAPQPAAVLGRVSDLLYGEPSASMPVVAVTGTDGKTTTCWLIAAALDVLGVPAGLIGSVETRLAGRRLLYDEPQHRRTTAEAPDLQATLALLRERGARAAVLEASSHGLALGRLRATRVEVAVFTNLGHEHLDFHGRQRAYFAAKASLFDPAMTRRAVVNIDDRHGRRLAAMLRRDGRDLVTVSAAGSPAADWRAGDLRLRPDGTEFTAAGPDGTAVRVRLQLAGRFNVDNGLAALAALTQLGLSPAAGASGLGALAAVPGRMHWVPPVGAAARPGRLPVRGLIDYAHTPGALQALLTAARGVLHEAGGDPNRPPSRILLVFGTGGGRDTGKRERMGRAAAGADVVILTDDNPRHEHPDDILAALRAGIGTAPGRSPDTHVERNRDAAIGLAVGLANPGDLVVVAGKGADRVQLVGDHVLPADDESALRTAITLAHSPSAPRGSTRGLT